MLRRLALVLLALLAGGGISEAATILNVTGPQSFGFANQIVMVEGWSQTSTFSGVSITMPLADLTSGGPIGGTEGTIYLVNQIGPGTTAANQIAPPVTISGLTAAFTPHLLFSGLTLPAGNYFVVIKSTSAGSLSSSPQGSSTPVVLSGVGVAPLGSDGVIASAAFPPATPLSPTQPGNLFIDVTGNLVSVAGLPTLNGAGLLALLAGLAAVSIFLLRRS